MGTTRGDRAGGGWHVDIAMQASWGEVKQVKLRDWGAEWEELGAWYVPEVGGWSVSLQGGPAGASEVGGRLFRAQVRPWVGPG